MILSYFDNKLRKIQKYVSLTEAIREKENEAIELTKSYSIYKAECEELVKSSNLNGEGIEGNKKHIEERFNRYFMDYVNELGEIKKSVESIQEKQETLIKRNPWIKEEIEKGEKESKKPAKRAKFEKVMREFKEGKLKSSSGEKVTDREQAIAIAYSESEINKSEIEGAMVTIIKGYENKLINDKDFQIAKSELQEFIELFEEYPLEKAEKLKGGLGDNKTLEDIAKKHKVELKHIQDQFKMGEKVEMEHTDDKKKAGEVARDHLTEDPDYYTKLAEMEKEKGEKDELKKAEEAQILLEKVYPQAVEKIREALKYGKKEIQQLKELENKVIKYADAIIWNQEGKLLFLKRQNRDKMFNDMLGFPGGGIEENESPKDAVLRELKEETGLDGKNPHEIAVASNPEIHYFNVTVDEPYVIILDEKEHKNYEWLTLEELENRELIPNLAENLKTIYEVGYKVRKL